MLPPIAGILHSIRHFRRNRRKDEPKILTEAPRETCLAPRREELSMIVRSLAELSGTDRDVDWGNGQSRRFLVERDSMGFALCDTTVLAGTESLMQYRNHLMACYCIAGQGEVEDMEGHVFRIEPGVLYALDRHDKYRLRAHSDLRVVCVFNPPITGQERHAPGAQGASGY